MKSKKKIIIIVIVVILILAAIIGGVVYVMKNRNSSVVDVYSMELLNSSGWASGESSLSGTISSDYVQEVYADEDQNVEEVYVQQGDYVKAGDKLMKYDVEQQELDLKLQELEIQSSTLELEDLESELSKMKNARASGTIDGSGSSVMNASVNLSALKGDILATVMNSDATEKDSTSDTESSTAASEATTSSETTTTESATTTADTETDTQTKESTKDTSTDDTSKQTTTATTKEENSTTKSKSSVQKSKSAKKSGEEKQTNYLESIDSLEDKTSGDGSEENPYIFYVKETGKIKASVLNELAGENISKQIYAEIHVENNDTAIIITPDYFFYFEDGKEEYSLGELKNGLKIRKLKNSVQTINDRDPDTGEGTDGAPYIFLLKGDSNTKMIAGSVIIDLLDSNATAVFKVYESEASFVDGSDNPVASFVFNPVYDKEGFDVNTVYSITDIKETIKDKKLKSKIEIITDKIYGDGSANDPYIYLLSKDGTVKGSVILTLAGGDYYAEFQEFESEDAYKENPYSPQNSGSIQPGTPIAGIEATKEYTLVQLQAALKAAEEASKIPSVLKSEITDKKNDAYSGTGTMDEPYVYRLISDGRIKGAVINDLMKNNEFAVFYEYDSEEDGRQEKVANSIEIRPNTIFKESIASFGWYTLTDLNDAMVTADQIQIRPKRSSVTAGKTYNFTAKLSGKNSDVLAVTWELKRNKSDATTLINGTLTVGEDETADTLRIIASAGGKRDELTVKVKQKVSSDTDNDGSGSSGGSGSDFGGGDSGGSGSSGSDTDYSGYTAEELDDAISEKEKEIAEAKQNLNEAKLDYEEAKKEVDAATVTAKVEGEVTLAYTKEAMPDDGSPAIVVRGEDGMYVEVDVSELSLDTVKVGGTIYCTSLETYEQYEAEIIEISPYPASNSSSDYSYDGGANPNSSYYPVVAYIAEADGLVTGESVEVTYNQQSMGTVSEESIYLQKAYVRTDDDGKSYVYKEGKNKRLEKQYVKTGETLYGQYVEILSGLTMDDKIAFPYGKGVKEGAKVELSENTDNIIY